MFDQLTKGVIHVGAHSGQEYDEYLQAGVRKIIFFEPVKSNYLKLLDRIAYSKVYVKCYRLALGNETGTREILIETANDGMSCSFLEPKEHLKQYPWITFETKELVKIDKLDNINFNRKDFGTLNIDVQGFELEVLKGAVQTLKTIDIVLTEVNIKEMYEGCALIGDIDCFLATHGFRRITETPSDNWGDAVYVKNKFVKD